MMEAFDKEAVYCKGYHKMINKNRRMDMERNQLR